MICIESTGQLANNFSGKVFLVCNLRRKIRLKTVFQVTKSQTSVSLALSALNGNFLSTESLFRALFKCFKLKKTCLTTCLTLRWKVKCS